MPPKRATKKETGNVSRAPQENLTDLKKNKVAPENVQDTLLSTIMAVPDSMPQNAPPKKSQKAGTSAKQTSPAEPESEVCHSKPTADQIRPDHVCQQINKLKKPKQDEIKVQDRRPSKDVQDVGEEASKQPAARKPTPAAQGGVTNPGTSKSKPSAKRKRTTPTNDDDSVPTDSSDDGKQLTLAKLKRTIDRHARWCPFVRLNRKIRNRHRRIEAMIASFDSDSDSEQSQPATKRAKTKKSDSKQKQKPTGNDDDDDDNEHDSEDEDESGNDDQPPVRNKAAIPSKKSQDPKSREFGNEGSQVEASGDNNQEPTSATQREPKPKPKPTKASQKSANEGHSAQPQQRKSNQAQAAAKKSTMQRPDKVKESGHVEVGPSVKPAVHQKKIEDSPELGKRVKPAGELTDESDLPVAEKPVTETAGKGKGRAP